METDKDKLIQGLRDNLINRNNSIDYWVKRCERLTTDIKHTRGLVVYAFIAGIVITKLLIWIF